MLGGLGIYKGWLKILGTKKRAGFEFERVDGIRWIEVNLRLRIVIRGLTLRSF